MIIMNQVPYSSFCPRTNYGSILHFRGVGLYLVPWKLLAVFVVYITQIQAKGNWRLGKF